ncbi:type I toxin-antitoxin system Fst family toxin [Staphylococcus schleiferi]|nr:type I toxin-antitoxin system Fst family toxin [Staphylococcus schleiferi]
MKCSLQKIAPIICGCAIAYFSHWLENRKGK